jgi:hypothetical protein
MSVYLSPIGGAGVQFFNDDGIPLSGGKLFTYLAGTTTPQTTYTTAVGNVAHSNPIVLDAAGRVPAGGEIWFDDQTLYKLVLTTSDESLVATWDDLPGINNVIASQIPYTPGGTNAVTTTVQAKLRQTITLEDFGAVGDGATNDTTAFVNAFTYLGVLTGGKITGTSGKNYAVACPIGDILVTMTLCNNIDIDFALCKITDTTTYTGTQKSTLFNFVTCTKIRVVATVQSQQSIAISPVATNLRGLEVIRLTQGGSQLQVDLNLIGGFEGINAFRLTSDPISYQFSGITGKIKSYGVYYPYVGTFSGNNVDLVLEQENCGRPFFIYGANHNKFRLWTKNIQITALIKAYEGLGCQNVDVDWTDTQSDYNQPAAPRLSIEWGDSTPAIHSDIRINVNWKNPAASPWGNSLGFAKLLDGGSTPDSTGRGHRLYGLKLTGFSDNTGTSANHVNWEAGGFSPSGTPDLMTGYEVGPFVALGSNNAMNWKMFALGTAVFNSVQTEQNIYTDNGSQGRVLFNNCQAGAFTSGTNNTDVHNYLYCNIASSPVGGGLQAYDIQKTFMQTQINSLGYVTGGQVQTSSNALSGDLTGTNNIFKVVPVSGQSLQFMVKYYLTSDKSESDPLVKNETYGIKWFSVFLNTVGVFAVQTAPVDMVTERTLNTASVLTLSLVDGTASGAFIAASATNYNGASAGGFFEITMMCGFPFTAINPV